MIDNVKVDKVFKGLAATIGANISETVIYNGDIASLQADEQAIIESTLFGDDSTVGVSNSSSDIQMGVFQLNCKCPIASKTQRDCLMLAMSVKNYLAKGLILESGNQKVKLKTPSISPLLIDDTHNAYVVSVGFTCIA